MGFGNKVTDVSSADVTYGYFGYIIKLDVTALLFHTINSVQAQGNPDNTPAPVVAEVTVETLQGYLNDINSPDLAFNYSDGQIRIFFRDTGEAIPVWSANTSYAVGTIVRNLADDDKIFIVVTAGISNGSEPTWSTTSPTTDNTVSWAFLRNLPMPGPFPYVAATRYALFGTRKAQDATADGDTLDFPDKDLQLVLDYAKQLAWQVVKSTIPRDLEASIKKEELRVRQD